MPLLSRLAAENRRDDVRAELQRTMRLVLALVAPVAVAVFALAAPLGTLIGSWGEMTGQTEPLSNTIAAFAPAIVFFSLQYMTLRGFYALEDTRTPFFIQIVLAATNIGLAITLTAAVPANQIAPVLAIAYGVAYLVGSATSLLVLSTRVGPVVDWRVLGYAVRLTTACATAGAAMLVVLVVFNTGDVADVGDKLGALVIVGSAGLVGAATYLAAAWVLRLSEVQDVVRTVLRRGAR